MNGFAKIAIRTANGYGAGDLMNLRPADTYSRGEHRRYLIQPVTGLVRDDFRDMCSVQYDMRGPDPAPDIRPILRQRNHFIDWPTRVAAGDGDVPAEGGRTATEADVLNERKLVRMTSRTKIIVETR